MMYSGPPEPKIALFHEIAVPALSFAAMRRPDTSRRSAVRTPPQSSLPVSVVRHGARPHAVRMASYFEKD